MEFLFYLYIFIVGTFIGSFLGVIVDRLPRQLSFIQGRSRCDHCHRTLTWNELIPVWSFLFLQGKCSACHKKISWFYPAIELFTGSLFVITALTVFGYGTIFSLHQPYSLVYAAYLLTIISALTIIFFVDLKYGIIPFPVVLFAFFIVSVWYIFSPLSGISGTSFLNVLFSAIGSFAFFFTLFIVTKGRGLGFGDVIYVFLMGFLLGFPAIIVSFYLAFISGALVSLLLVSAGQKKMKGTIPFGPFLVSGTIVSLLWGDQIITIAVQYLF